MHIKNKILCGLMVVLSLNTLHTRAKAPSIPLAPDLANLEAVKLAAEDCIKKNDNGDLCKFMLESHKTNQGKTLSYINYILSDGPFDTKQRISEYEKYRNFITAIFANTSDTRTHAVELQIALAKFKRPGHYTLQDAIIEFHRMEECPAPNFANVEAVKLAAEDCIKKKDNGDLCKFMLESHKTNQEKVLKYIHEIFRGSSISPQEKISVYEKYRNFMTENIANTADNQNIKQ
jgi:hypothetical protein